MSAAVPDAGIAADFYGAIEPFDAFARVVDPAVFHPVPDGHWLGLTDIVDSTRAIALGRYKAVNMAGAAVIGAVLNALGGRSFPFVFGGDGASFIVGPPDLEQVREAASATASWVKAELGLDLRAAMIPVDAIRRAGLDLRVARFEPFPGVAYAMLGGGGHEWAEAAVKRGEFALAPPPPGARPDLTGLSCRWQPLASRNGTILSLIVRRAPDATPKAFGAMIETLLGLFDADARQGHPVPPEGPSVGWPSAGFDLEARASRGRTPLALRRLALVAETLAASVVFKRNLTVGRFDPAHYRRQNALNADFRKFDDGLRMTVDCRIATAGRVEALLADARQRGIVRFGTHHQQAAQITCIVPSALTDHHFHFIDGANGGYAAAAHNLK